jgi:hypothetical protein
MRSWLPLALLLSACTNPPTLPPPDVVGPFSGPTLRFVVDWFYLPQLHGDYAEDLDRDGRPDNELAYLMSALSGQNLGGPAIGDLVASGTLASSVEITTDDPTLTDDPTVGVRFIGRDDAPSDTMGATLVAGRIASNRTATTTHPAALELHLPLFADADPSVFNVLGVDADLWPDTDGGLWGALRGGIPKDEIFQQAYAGFIQRLLADPFTPNDATSLYDIFDLDNDGTITFDEFSQNQIAMNVLSVDIQLTDNGGWHPTPDGRHKDSFSFAFGFHLTACASGRCAAAPPSNHCDDRILDGDETDLDCGGSCLPCPTARACSTGKDCRSALCDGGKCAAPTCDDGVRDGFEREIDCGSLCGACLGDYCGTDYPCRFGTCVRATCT